MIRSVEASSSTASTSGPTSAEAFRELVALATVFAAQRLPVWTKKINSQQLWCIECVVNEGSKPLFCGSLVLFGTLWRLLQCDLLMLRQPHTEDCGTVRGERAWAASRLPRLRSDALRPILLLA